MFSKLIFAALVALTQVGCNDLASYVNVFTGTDGPGHAFPAAATPFGLVQAGPDTGNGSWKYCSGYAWGDDAIIGFTQDHLNGTGCPDLGDIRLMPFSADAERERAPFDKADEQATPGFYAVKFKSGIKTEITVSRHSALYRFTFGKGPKKLMVDTQFGIWSWGKPNSHLKADKTVIDGKRGISGLQTRHRWTKRCLGYAVEFDRDFAAVTELERGEDEKAGKYVFEFDLPDDATLCVKVALSSTSPEAAKRNLAAEIPGWDFAGLAKAARADWNKLFARATIEGSDEQKQNWYTALYHLYLQPNDIADVGEKPCYSTFSLWDTFRAAHPFYTLATPEVVGDMVNSMLVHARNCGRMPIWALWGNETRCMIGNHSIPVVVDWFFKTLGKPEHDAIDWTALFEAMKDSVTADHKTTKENWDVLNRYGYYPFDLIPAQSASRTLECSYDDTCLARMARALGRAEDAAFFAKRGESWKMLIDPETGFVRGRDSAGNWRTPFDPYEFGHGNDKKNDFTEGNSFQYSWHVLQDPQGLIDRLGGDAATVRRLDRLFEASDSLDGKYHSSDISGMIGQYVHGNEPSHHVIYFYTLAGRPDRAAERLRDVFDRFYSPRPDGLCGNDDCGQMSAWYLFSAMGFYPFDPASGEYVLGAPQLPAATIALPDGKTFRMVAKGLSKSAKYVKSVSFDGKPLSGCKLKHADLIAGGELVFEMTDRPVVPERPKVAAFRPGERVAFFGDSITHNGGYVSYLQLFQALRHPGSGARMINLGISGDSAGGGVKRIGWDVMKARPDRVFVMFGMNDVRRSFWVDDSPDAEAAAQRKEALELYAANQRRIVEYFATNAVETVLVTPSPYDQYSVLAMKDENPRCNEPGLAGCAEIVRALAAEKQLPSVEFHRPFTEILKQATNYVFCADRVHPNKAGHLLMAVRILETIGVEPEVAVTRIDAAKARKLGSGIAFDYRPAALPFPILPEYAEAERVHPITDNINREMLVVSGLEKGEYALAFDGSVVGRFSAEQLAEGVNLALLDTPNRRKAFDAAKVAEEIHGIERKLRTAGALIEMRLRGGKVDVADRAAVDRFLDAWLEKSAGSRYLGTYRDWVGSYRATRDKVGEIRADCDRLYAVLDGIRPVRSTVTLSPVAR